MKKSFTLLSLLLITLVVMADPITPESARRAAAKFLQNQGSQLKNEAMRAPRRAMGKMSSTEASPYYVFNADAGKGFVVISGDDCVGENLVLGYTTSGLKRNMAPNVFV
ncbi:MAG: Spi family protease inhibitor, partial [Spirochaetia bacterium]|nr:Spi family protease inhibitor [Spirochaetia bacterium]